MVWICRGASFRWRLCIPWIFALCCRFGVFLLKAVVSLGVYFKLDCRSDMHSISLLDIYKSISLLLNGQCAVNCIGESQSSGADQSQWRLTVRRSYSDRTDAVPTSVHCCAGPIPTFDRCMERLSTDRVYVSSDQRSTESCTAASLHRACFATMSAAVSKRLVSQDEHGVEKHI